MTGTVLAIPGEKRGQPEEMVSFALFLACISFLCISLTICGFVLVCSLVCSVCVSISSYFVICFFFSRFLFLLPLPLLLRLLVLLFRWVFDPLWILLIFLSKQLFLILLILLFALSINRYRGIGQLEDQLWSAFLFSSGLALSLVSSCCDHRLLFFFVLFVLFCCVCLSAMTAFEAVDSLDSFLSRSTRLDLEQSSCWVQQLGDGDQLQSLYAPFHFFAVVSVALCFFVLLDSRCCFSFIPSFFPSFVSLSFLLCWLPHATASKGLFGGDGWAVWLLHESMDPRSSASSFDSSSSLRLTHMTMTWIVTIL